MDKACFTAAELAAATGGCWQNGADPAGKWFINTDSRTIKAGECFLPIVGERFDGHDFLDKLPSGVIALAQKNKTTSADLPLLLVDDTLKAYQDIALFHRKDI